MIIFFEFTFCIWCIACVFFLYASIYRLTHNFSIISPRSRCDNCQTKLKPFELIPILSFLWQRGHCRYCATAIGWPSLVVETTGGFIVAGIICYPLRPKMILLVVLMFLMLTLAILDSKTLSVPTYLLALTAILAIGYQPSSWQFLIYIFSIWLLAQLPLRRFNQIGLADVDLIFIIYWLSGLTQATIILLIACLSALGHFKIRPHTERIPFIPHLALAFITWTIIYLHIS